MSGIYIKYDSELNALDDLEKAVHYISEVDDDPHNWKWVVRCCHSAMYGFAITAAKGSDDLSVVKVTKSGHRKLITFDEALKICCQSQGARHALDISNDERKSLRFLQDQFRNRFEHFLPGCWSIEVSGFPSHVLNQIHVIRRLAIDINFYSHLQLNELERLEAILSRCETKLEELANKYA